MDMVKAAKILMWYSSTCRPSMILKPQWPRHRKRPDTLSAVTDEIFRSKLKVFDEAENRMHTAGWLLQQRQLVRQAEEKMRGRYLELELTITLKPGN